MKQNVDTTCKTLKILGFQPHIGKIRSVQDRQAHVDNLIATLEIECQQHLDIDLILLPELSTIGYSRAAFQRLPELAEPIQGDSFRRFAQFVERTGCTVAYGYPRIDKNGRYHISHNVIAPSGTLLATYDKLHMAQFGASMEKDYFSPGSHVAAFELNGFRLGLMICYDMRFPELARLYATTYSVDAILHPVAFTKDETFESWHPFIITRAIENQIYFLSLNQAGEQWGSSIFCPPWVDGQHQPTLFGSETEANIFVIEKERIAAARSQYPYAQDKLANYASLTAL